VLLRCAFSNPDTSILLFDRLARFLSAFTDPEHEHVMRWRLPVLLIELVKLFHGQDIVPEKRRAILPGYMAMFDVCEREMYVICHFLDRA
jgi:hypothetical protein